MMKISKSPTKQIEYASKLKLVDNHISKNEYNLAATVNNEYEQIVKMMALKLSLQPQQQIHPFTNKTIIFDKFQSKSFIVRDLIAPNSKNYILNVQTFVPIRLELKIIDRPSKFYNFQGSKAIQINQTNVSEATIVATVQKTGIFSIVKFYLDLMQVQYNSNKKSSINLRPNIDKQLQDYLAQNRGKSAQILRNRSLARTKQMLMRKSMTNFNQKPLKSIQLIRSKSQFQAFQRKKSMYIKHVRKMSPSKVKILAQSQNKYHTMKREQLIKLATIIYMAKFGYKVAQEKLKKTKQRLRKIKVTMLCSDFIKIIKNKFRLKMTEKARLRMNMHHTMQFIPLLLRGSNVTKAKSLLLDFLTPFMDFKTVLDVCDSSQYYLESITKIQRYARKKGKDLRDRVSILNDILVDRHHISLSKRTQEQIKQRYVKQCIKKRGKVTKVFTLKEKLLFFLMDTVE